MQMKRTLRFAVCASATVIGLAGCGATGQPSAVVPGQAPVGSSAVGQSVLGNALGGLPAITANASGGLYVAQVLGTAINEYALPDENNLAAKCAERAKIAVAMAVSARHILYVAEQRFIGGYQTFPIETFGPNCGAKGITLLESFGYPTSVAIDNKSGRVYVAWYALAGTGGGVIVYDKDKRYPTRLLSNSTIIGNGGVAVDSSGNVLWSGYAPTSIAEFPHGQQKGSAVITNPGFSYPYSLELDRNDNLVASDTGSGTIDVFAPPYTGTPTLTIPTKGYTLSVKLDAANQNLYASDFTNGSVDVYAYPSGTFEYSITTGLVQSNYVYGVAVDPPTGS
jgi:hypothetical protein